MRSDHEGRIRADREVRVAHTRLRTLARDAAPNAGTACPVRSVAYASAWAAGPISMLAHTHAGQSHAVAGPRLVR